MSVAELPIGELSLSESSVAYSAQTHLEIEDLGDLGVVEADEGEQRRRTARKARFPAQWKAMAAHKYCGGEAAAAELAVDEAASTRRSDGRAQAGRWRKAASERRSDGRAQVLQRRSGSGAGCRGGCV